MLIMLNHFFIRQYIFFSLISLYFFLLFRFFLEWNHLIMIIIFWFKICLLFFLGLFCSIVMKWIYWFTTWNPFETVFIWLLYLLICFHILFPDGFLSMIWRMLWIVFNFCLWCLSLWVHLLLTCSLCFRRFLCLFS